MSDSSSPWSAVIPTYIDGKGEALVVSRDLPKGTRLLRVAPFAAVPYGKFLDSICSGCLQPCDEDGTLCAQCGVVRHCSTCARSFTGDAHSRHECFALQRLKNNDEGLTLAHDDLRLLLRVLSRRKKAIDDETNAGEDTDETNDDADEASPVNIEMDPVDPATTAASNDSDLIVDCFADFDELMSGTLGGDDGELPDSAITTLTEVSKQCKFLVNAECRTSLDTYVSLLGKLQLNGFEITTAKAEGEGEQENANEKSKKTKRGNPRTNSKNSKGLHAPIGLGVYPSAARFNHSCAPNCHQRFDEYACAVIETNCAVKKGTELTIPYVDINLDVTKRNERLVKNFAFSCRCGKCESERGKA